MPCPAPQKPHTPTRPTAVSRFNYISPLVGAGLAGAAVVLVDMASRRGDACRIVSFSIYGATLTLDLLKRIDAFDARLRTLSS